MVFLRPNLSKVPFTPDLFFCFLPCKKCYKSIPLVKQKEITDGVMLITLFEERI